MKVLVTGANGFLGSHIVRALLDMDYGVKAFILRGTSESSLEGLKYERYIGDLLNKNDIEEALKSCDYLIHTAAITDVWPTRSELAWKINFDLVKQLADVVKRSSIKKWVNVGTANTFGFGSIDNPGSESSPFNCGKYKLDYIDSKKAAQDFLLDEAKSNELPVTIVNPTFMIGEFDSKPGSGELIISLIEGKIFGNTAGGRCFAAVKDVALACVHAIKKGKIGECYILGGVNLNYKNFYSLVAKITNTKAPRFNVPKIMVLFLGTVLDLISKITKKKPKFSRSIAKISNDGHYYSSLKAINELSYNQTKLETAIREAITWYKDNGYTK